MTSEDNNDIVDDGTAGSGEIILNHSLNTEMKNSYINYAMSVIIGRALPDARDGLKPVHRRVLYGMFEGGHTADKKFSKSARSVGEVMGKYHPHGDQSIYDTMVRMAQEFSLRYPLVDGQGNFGSIDGDPPAAMRYTESRLDRIAKHMLDDINKNTVDFQPNFDDSENEPSVLPARLPNLLLNGSDGIAVGMATRIPPHNLTEVAGAVNLHVDTILETGSSEKPSISIEEYMQHVKGPDFPTGASIHGIDGIADMYATGKVDSTFEPSARCLTMRGVNASWSTRFPTRSRKPTCSYRLRIWSTRKSSLAFVTSGMNLPKKASVWSSRSKTTPILTPCSISCSNPVGSRSPTLPT